MSAKKPPEEKIGNVAPFGLRMLPGLRARVEKAAARKGRSLNAEIVETLESAYPEPPKLDETIKEIAFIIGLLKKFKRQDSLHALADSLDYLVFDISRDQNFPESAREAAKKYIEESAKFNRAPFTPPKDFD